jgi:hypothetical protein
MKQNVGKIVRIALTVLILVGLVLFARTVNWRVTWDRIREADRSVLMLAALVNMLSLALKAVRWWIFLRPVGAPSLWMALKATFAGAGLNNILVANGGEGAFLDIGQGWSRNGEWRCPSQEDVGDKPCINVARNVKSDDNVGRINLNYKVTDDALVYATWSEGFRPGGINRNPFVADYVPDFLTNWELGWKTQWGGNLQFNGAVFLEQWDHLQRAFQGTNGITTVDNAPSAEIKGAEVQARWVATDNLVLSAAGCLAGVVFARWAAGTLDLSTERGWFLASALARHVTGEVLNVNGGSVLCG